jgi:hypothetical protein
LAEAGWLINSATLIPAATRKIKSENKGGKEAKSLIIKA